MTYKPNAAKMLQRIEQEFNQFKERLAGVDELEPWQRDLIVSFMRPLRDANIDWALHDEYGRTVTNKQTLNEILKHIHWATGYVLTLEDVDTFVLRDVLNDAEDLVIELRERET